VQALIVGCKWFNLNPASPSALVTLPKLLAAVIVKVNDSLLAGAPRAFIDLTIVIRFEHVVAAEGRVSQ
jgi:hypothetical protein